MSDALRVPHLGLFLLEVTHKLLPEDSPLHSIKEYCPDVVITGVWFGVLADSTELELTHQVEVIQRDAEDTAWHVCKCRKLGGFFGVDFVFAKITTWAHLINFDFECPTTSVLLSLGGKTDGSLVVDVELHISVKLNYSTPPYLNQATLNYIHMREGLTLTDDRVIRGQTLKVHLTCESNAIGKVKSLELVHRVYQLEGLCIREVVLGWRIRRIEISCTS